MAVWMRYRCPGGRVTAYLLCAMCFWLVLAGDVTRAESIVPAELNCYLRARASAWPVYDEDTGWNEVYAHAESTPYGGASASMYCANYVDGDALFLGWAGSSGTMTGSEAFTYLYPEVLTIGTSAEVPPGTPLLLRVELYGQSGFSSGWSFDLRRGSTYLVSEGGWGNEVFETYEVEIYAGEALTPSAYVYSGGMEWEGLGAYVSVDFTVLPGPGTLAPLDIRPGSCPNSFNRNSHGVLPAALLGTDDFDATMIDVSSVLMSRADGIGGSVAPHEGPPGPHSVLEDVGTPFEGEWCDCHDLGGDGITDLMMHFKTDEVAEVLGLSDLDSGAWVGLVVTGNLLDGTPFRGGDCIRLVPPGTAPGLLTVESNVAGVWIDASPLDETLDGGGFADFERTYPLTTVVTLTAEMSSHGQSFVAWQIDGEMQEPGENTVQFVMDGSMTMKALYRAPVFWLPWQMETETPLPGTEAP